MTWLKMDAGWLMHPKVRRAGVNGRALWMAAALYSSDQETDGRIDKHMVSIIAAQAEVPAKAAELLVDAGLWVDQGEWYEIHDFLAYNPSREQLTVDRARAKERQARHRSVTPDVTGLSRRDIAVTNGVTNGDVTGVSQGTDPTRPDPLSIKTSTTTSNSASPTVGAVVEAIVEIEYQQAQAGQRAEHPKRYRDGIRRRVQAEWGPLLDAAFRAGGLVGAATEWPAHLASLVLTDHPNRLDIIDLLEGDQ